MATTKTKKKGEPAHDAGPINLTVNGQAYQLNVGGRSGEVEPFQTLSYTLRRP